MKDQIGIPRKHCQHFKVVESIPFDAQSNRPANARVCNVFSENRDQRLRTLWAVFKWLKGLSLPYNFDDKSKQHSIYLPARASACYESAADGDRFVRIRSADIRRRCCVSFKFFCNVEHNRYHTQLGVRPPIRSSLLGIRRRRGNTCSLIAFVACGSVDRPAARPDVSR